MLASADMLLTLATSLERLAGTPEGTLSDVIIASASEEDARITATLEGLRELPDPPAVVLVGDTGDPSAERRLLSLGVAAVIPGRGSDAEVARALRPHFERRRRGRGGSVHPADLAPSAHPHSTTMIELLGLCDRVSGSDTSVLILGETGTGKEWVARRIHAASKRAEGPFVPVSCAAIPEGLVESELFGHVKGAFTGAIRAKRGYFEIADGGTLFLDEVGEIPRHIQVKLLRALQDHTFQPVGGEKQVKVDVRIIAATNRNLTAAVASGDFRQDLFYRLGVVTLNVPPLRERPEDVVGLIDAYARHFADLLHRPVPSVAPEAAEVLTRYRWPGNIRELINLVERAVLLGTGSVIGLGELPAAMWVEPATNGSTRGLPEEAPAPENGTPSFVEARDQAIRQFELRYLHELLDATGGRVGAAARRAGISPRTLYTKMRRHGLRKEDYKL